MLPGRYTGVSEAYRRYPEGGGPLIFVLSLLHDSFHFLTCALSLSDLSHSIVMVILQHPDWQAYKGYARQHGGLPSPWKWPGINACSPGPTPQVVLITAKHTTWNMHGRPALTCTHKMITDKKHNHEQRGGLGCAAVHHAALQHPI